MRKHGKVSDGPEIVSLDKEDIKVILRKSPSDAHEKNKRDVIARLRENISEFCLDK